MSVLIRFKEIISKNLFFLLILFVSSLDAQIPSGGLVGAWPFSGNANDVSGNNNHGTAFGGAVLTNDRCGNPNSAYLFNGSTSYVQMLTAGPSGNASRSISFWAKTTYTQVNSPRSAFDYGTALGSGDSYQIVWSYCALGVGLDLSNQAIIRGNNCLYNNTWHHIVSVYNSSVSNVYSSVVYYIDGVAQPAILCNVSGTTATINTGTVFPVTVGRGATSATRYFNGALDDVYLYNRPLSAAEVLQLYTAMPSCPPPIQGNTLVCPGSVQIYSVDPITNATFTWTLPGGWTGSSSSNTISTVAGNNSGTISVAASSSCGIFPTSTLAVSVYTLPPLSISSSNSVSCSGIPVILTASGAISYTWFPGSLISSTLGVSPLVTTAYTVVGSYSNSCIQQANFTQSVVSNPTLTINSATSVACNGNTIALFASGATSYTWLPGNSNSSSVVATPTTGTTYTVIGLTPFGCAASATQSVFVPPVLSVSVSALSFTACPGNSITLSANVSGGTPPYSYLWSNGSATNSASFQSSLSANFNPSVTVQDANSCSLNTSAPIIFVVVGTLTAASKTVCPNTLATLTVSGSNTYTWQPSGTTGNTFTLMASSPQQLTINATSSLGCLTNTVTSLFIKPTPTLSFNTFSITCGSLGSATVLASGGTGPFSYTWTPTAQTTSVVNNLFPGTYTVTFLDSGTGCVFTPTTNFLPLVPLTGTVSATSSLLCNGVNNGTASIFLAGGSGNQTYTWTSSSGPLYTPTVTSLPAGVNTVQVSDALTHCSLTHTFLITQPPALTLNISPSSPSVCLGGTVILIASNSGGQGPYTYTWIPGLISNSLSVSESSSGIYSYSVLSRDANLCLSSLGSTISFVPNPTISVSDVSICPLETGSLIAGGASTYTWNTGITGALFAYSPSITTQYTVIGSALSCTSSATASIIIKPIPQASASNNGPLCTGQTLALSSSGGLAYWTGPLSFTSNLSNPSIIPVSQINSGMYQVKITAANNCTASALTSVSIHPVPFLSVMGSTVCEGQTLNLWSSAFPGTSYFWSGPNSFTSNLQSPGIASSTTLMTGPYSLFIISAQSCTNSAVLQASVASTPSVTVTGNNIICKGDVLQLTASGADSYYWQGPNNFYYNLASINISNIPQSSSGFYSLTAVRGPCTVNTGTQVTVHPLPILTASNNSPVCETKNGLLFAGGANTYTWSGPMAFSSTQQNPALLNVSPPMSGVYSFTAADNNNCRASASCTFEVWPNPIPVTRGDSVCIGNSAQLYASGGVSYNWSGPGGFTSTLPNPVIPNVNLAASGLYTVVVNAPNGCSVQVQIPLFAFSYPLPVPLISGNASPCLNSALILSGSGGSSYFWNGPNNFTSTAQQFSLTAQSAASGVYTLSVVNASNCVASQTITINVLPLPKALLSSSVSNFCVPFCATIKLQADSASPEPIASISYYNGQSISTNPFELCFSVPGQHSISSVFTDSKGCSGNSTLFLDAHPNLNADFYFRPEHPLAGIDVVEFLNASSGSGQTQWSWFFMANNTDTVFSQNCTYLFGQSGTYPVALMVKNQWGCSDTVIKVIRIEDEFVLYVPNTFSPNHDGINDIFQPKGMGFIDFQMEIYDRWGALVFSTLDFYQGWDGFFMGTLCQSGTYNWKIQLKTSTGKSITRLGNLNLIQ